MNPAVLSSPNNEIHVLKDRSGQWVIATTRRGTMTRHRLWSTAVGRARCLGMAWHLDVIVHCARSGRVRSQTRCEDLQG